METRLLDQFVTVAAEGSVTRAAERLWAAQSTVSAGIASLERSLGVRLFDRTGRQLVLTTAGEDLLPHARSVLESLDRMRDLATVSDAELRGRVRLGIFTSMDIVDLTGVLRGFRQRHPLVAVELMTSPSGTTGLVQDLAAGRLDIAYTGLPAVPRGSPSNRCGRCRSGCSWQPTTLRGPRLGVARGPRRRALHRHRARVRQPDHPRQCARATRHPRRIVAEMNDMPAVVRFAAAGLGVGVVPDSGVRHDGVVLELEDEVEPLRIGLATRTSPEPNRAVRALARDVVAARIA